MHKKSITFRMYTQKKLGSINVYMIDRMNKNNHEQP